MPQPSNTPPEPEPEPNVVQETISGIMNALKGLLNVILGRE